MIWFACAFNLQSFMSQTDLIVHNNLDQSIQTQYAWATGVKFILEDLEKQVEQHPQWYKTRWFEQGFE